MVAAWSSILTLTKHCCPVALSQYLLRQDWNTALCLRISQQSLALTAHQVCDFPKKFLSQLIVTEYTVFFAGNKPLAVTLGKNKLTTCRPSRPRGQGEQQQQQGKPGGCGGDVGLCLAPRVPTCSRPAGHSGPALGQVERPPAQ
jgi:hypothetical protein